jgi:hypothetical protein
VQAVFDSYLFSAARLFTICTVLVKTLDEQERFHIKPVAIYPDI